MPFSIRDHATQRSSLIALAELTARASIDPKVVFTARSIVADCPARDDECELRAIYNAIKSGDPRIKGLKNGVRYVSDPRVADFFTGGKKLLEMCEAGACGSDCDEQASIVAALCGAIGFKVGLEAWGRTRKGDQEPEYEHVYAIVGYPKRDPPKDPKQFLGMDTTVPAADVGWKPPGGYKLSALIV